MNSTSVLKFGHQAIYIRQFNDKKHQRKYMLDFSKKRLRFALVTEETKRPWLICEQHKKTACTILASGDGFYYRIFSNFKKASIFYIFLYRVIHAFRMNRNKRLNLPCQSKWTQRLIHVNVVLKKLNVCNDLCLMIMQHVS
jgi:hypothetical protein